MAKILNAKLEGQREFKAMLKRYQKGIDGAVDSGLAKAAQDIVSEAKSRCTIPSIADGISMQKVGKLYQVTTQGSESAYLEFGTGNFAKALLGPYPADWVEMARTFFINGLGRTAAQPYLYPSFQHNAGESIIEIGDKIESL